MSSTALLLIDLQNDFLTPGGAFHRRFLPLPMLAAAVRGAAEIARQRGWAVVWVESVYGELSAEALAAHGKDTHTGAPCCVRGSHGAMPVAELADLAAACGAPCDTPETAGAVPDRLRLTKMYYSAFQGTGLQAWLEARGVRRLVLAGVATNVCVEATALAARWLGHEVAVLEDATSAGTLPKHLAALARMRQAGCAIRSWTEVADGPVVLGGGEGLQIGEGSRLHLGRVAGIGADTLAALTAEVGWQTMYHRGGEVPRRVATQGDIGPEGVEPLYRHPADDYPPVRPWTPLVAQLRAEAEALVGHPLNHCLIQLYRDGHDWIGAHSDKTLDMVPGTYIVNVSVGATRAMVLRRKGAAGEAREVCRLPLPHGSLLQMDPATNRAWLHEIRQQGAAGEIGPRISLTFRHIGSAWDPATQAAWGSGTPHADRAAAEEAAATRAAWTEEARLAWELDESERMLRLFRDENVRADFDAAAYRPGFEVIHLRHYQERDAGGAQDPAQAGEPADRPERDLFSDRAS